MLSLNPCHWPRKVHIISTALWSGTLPFSLPYYKNTTGIGAMASNSSPIPMFSQLPGRAIGAILIGLARSLDGEIALHIPY